MDIYFGVDPGQRGGIVAIDVRLGQETVFSSGMPLLPDGTLNADEIRCIFSKDNLPGSTVCYIEKAQPMPKQGVVSVFNYGKGYGMILACLQVLKIPYQEIPAAKWKKEFSLNRDKGASISCAMKLFPSIPPETFFTPRGRMLDGIAEALLIAEYARRHYK